MTNAAKQPAKYVIVWVDHLGRRHAKPEYGTFTSKRDCWAAVNQINCDRLTPNKGKYAVGEL